MSWHNVDPAYRELAQRVLTPRQLEVLRHRTNGVSYRKIAIALHVDEATIRGHERRAFTRLANALRKEAA